MVFNGLATSTVIFETEIFCRTLHNRQIFYSTKSSLFEFIVVPDVYVNVFTFFYLDNSHFYDDKKNCCQPVK